MIIGKAYWRGRIKEILSRLTYEDILKKSILISQHLKGPLTELVERASFPFILGGFAPLPGEPLWHLSLESLENHFAFPRLISPQEMAYYPSTLTHLKEEKTFGLSIPSPQEKGDAVVPHCLLVPALGFTPQGGRLGRGKGFYDRYLETFSGPKWGICFQEQIFSDLPLDDHDQKVDLVITDEGYHKC